MSEEKKQAEKITGLPLLRVPFSKNQISKLPKPTKQQTEEVRANYQAGIRCTECGGWHHPKVVHLDYVGHAALTDRLLDADENWNWEPVAVDEFNLPKFDQNGGLWINLTVKGVTRKGYGHPDGKQGGDAIKETIGDALRNAAMRFGAALELWHKGDLHEATEPIAEEKKTSEQPQKKTYQKDPYMFNDGGFKGKKFHEIMPEDFDIYLGKLENIEADKKTAAVNELIAKMKQFKAEKQNAKSK